MFSSPSLLFRCSAPISDIKVGQLDGGRVADDFENAIFSFVSIKKGQEEMLGGKKCNYISLESQANSYWCFFLVVVELLLPFRSLL